MKIHKITNTIGAEISGVDLSKPLTDQEKIDLKNALIDNYVVFFRDQIMDPEYLPTVISQFGENYMNVGEPKYKDNQLIGYFVAGENTVASQVEGLYMHSDRTSVSNPPRTSMLYITDCPEVGGDTVFANTIAAYNALRETDKKLFENTKAMHMSPIWSTRENIAFPPIPGKGLTLPQIMVHPLIATRPETGEKLIYVNEAFTVNIPGVPAVEGAQILSKLFHQIVNPRFSCRFRWTPNTIAWWDNLGTQHQAIWDYYPNKRTGHRVLTKNLY
jgi:taurine dioxygenase